MLIKFFFYNKLINNLSFHKRNNFRNPKYQEIHEINFYFSYQSIIAILFIIIKI